MSLRTAGSRDVITATTALLVLFLVGYPLIMLVVGSLSGPRPADAGSLGPRAYLALFQELGLLANSLKVAVGSTILAMTLGVSLAWVLARTNVPWAGALEQVVIIPFYLSALLGAVGWALLASPSKAGILNSLLMSWFHLEKAPFNVYSELGIIWVSGLHFAPFCFLFSIGALRSMEPSLEDSSRVLGGGTASTMIRITMPLILPAILGSSLLVFVLAMGQFGIPAVLGVSTGYHVVTTRIYELIIGFNPDYGVAAAMGVALFAFSALGVWLQIRILGSRKYTTVTGKGFRPRVIDVGGFRWVLFSLVIAYVIVAVVLPLGALLFASLQPYISTNIFNAKFTLANFHYILFEYPTTTLALFNTLLLAVGGATITLLLAGVLAWMLVRKRSALSRLIEVSIMIPVAIPGIVFSIGLLWAWIRAPLPIYGTIWILLLCYVTIFIPYGVRAVSASLHQIDQSLEECAIVIGASWQQVVRGILLPLLRPGLMAAWTLVFISIIKELSASALLYNSKTIVLSVAVFDLWIGSSLTYVAALALIEALVIFLVLWVTRRIVRAGAIL